VHDTSSGPIRPYGASAAREHLTEGYERPTSLTVDCHGHMLVPAADELVRPHLPASQLDAVRYASPYTREVNVQQNKDRWDDLIGLEKRLAEMDRMGVDVMVISPVPPQFNYAADAGLCAEASTIINDTLAKAAADRPDRLVAIGTVPLQDTDRAIAELDRCMGDLKMPGIEIGANVGQEELSAERLEPFWARAEELGATILLHPTAFASERLSTYYFTNTIGNPLDTTVAAHHIIYDGVLERYPDLKIILSHGGAFVSHYAARMDHAWGARPDCRGKLKNPPTQSLRKLYFDTIVFSPAQLALLIEQFGVDRLMIGTDYPFDMGEYDPIEHVLQTPGLSAADQAAICGANAVRLFGLDTAPFAKMSTAGRLTPNMAGG